MEYRSIVILFFIFLHLPSYSEDNCTYEGALSYIAPEDCNNAICMGIMKCGNKTTTFYCSSQNSRCPSYKECLSQNKEENIIPVKVQVRWRDTQPSIGALVFDQETNRILGETGADGVTRFKHYNGGKIRVTQPNYAVKCENVVSIDHDKSNNIDANGNYVIMTWWPFPAPLNSGDIH